MSEATLRFRLALLKVCLLLTLFAIISIATFAQNNSGGDRITMNVKNASYREIFSEIKKQTGKTVWHDDKFDDTKKLNVSFTNSPLSEVMNKILKKTDLSWKTRNDNILINEKDISNTVGTAPKSISNNQSGTDVSDPANNLIDINGTVTDEQNSPIPGATVLIKGTQTGTATNGDGTFILRNVPGNSTLSISSVSFVSRDIQVKNRRSIGITELSRLTTHLDDVVVLAYTTTTGRRLTGNVSKVKAKDIENSPVNNPILAAAGRVPGVTITQASGFAGSGVEIIIQGINSLNNGVSPFYVIDGVPYTQTLLPNNANVLGTSGRGSNGPVTGNPLSYINPQDIASIEILKDADATAIYGSRAANGAILITTKRGKEGRMKLSVNFLQGWGKVAKKLDLLNTKEYLTMRHEAKQNDNTPIGNTDYDLNGTWDSTRYTDWQKSLIGNKASYTDVQMALSGGSENTQYIIAGNLHKEKTVLPTDLSDTKSSIRFNFDTRSKDQKFKMSISSSYLNDNSKLPITDLTESAMTLSPLFPQLLTSNGELNWEPDSNGNSTISNPLSSLYAYYSNQTSNLIGNSILSYNITNNISVKANVGYNRLRTDEISTSPARVFAPEVRRFAQRGSVLGFNDIKSWIIEPQIAFSKKFTLVDLNMIVGSSFQRSDNSRKVIIASGFSNDEVLENLSAATNLRSGNTIISQYKYAAGFFSINLNRDEKYILNLTGRRDGSSRFGADNRYHSFGAAAFSWLFTNEDFIKNRFTFLSFGKIKVSYGSTGNDQIGDYNYLSLYQNNNTDIPYRGGGALTINRLNNPGLQWEETRKLSAGLDLAFIDERIVVNTNIYRNRSSNMLVPGSTPATAGPINSLTENIPALIQNKGIELLISSDNYRNKNVSWNTSLNLTINRNKVVSFGNLENSTYANSIAIGQPVNYIKTYRAAGVNPETGKYQFLDKEGKITESPDSDPLNFNHIIDPTQKVYGGLTNTITFRGFELSFLIQFVKQMGKNTPSTNPPGYGLDNQTKFVLNRWQKIDDVKPVQKYFTSDFSYYFPYIYRFQSDAYWEDASYIRLKNISISYNLPKHILSRANISGLKIYALAQNILTITSYDGLDPESLSNFSLPPLRVVTLGIQLTL